MIPGNNNVTEERTCPRCGSSDIGKVRESLVCKDCGAVIKESAVSSEEEPYYSFEDRVEKGRHSYDASLGASTKTERRNFSSAVSLANELCNKLHVPQFVENDIIKRLKQFMQVKTVRKDTISPVVAALMYIVGRRSRIPLSLENIAKVSNVDQGDIMTQYQDIVQKLRISVPQVSLEGLTMQFAKKVGLSPEAVARATEIANKLKGQVDLVMGKDPKSIAGAAVYLAAEEKEEEKTQDEIAKIASVSVITLRNRANELSKVPV